MISQSLVTLATGEVRVGLTVPFTAAPAPDQLVAASRPRVGQISDSTQNTGGSLNGGQNAYYYLTALDASGYRTRRSLPVEVVIPSGTNTNKVVLSAPTVLVWDCDTVAYELYRSLGDPFSPTRIASNITLPSGTWTYTDTGAAGDGTLPPDEHIVTHRVYWRKTGDTLWNFGAEATDRTQSSLSFLVPHNISGQSIDVQVRGVGIGGLETPQGIATTSSYVVSAQYPAALGIGAGPTSNPLSYNGNDIFDTGGIIVSRAVDFARSYVNKHLGNIPDNAAANRYAVINGGSLKGVSAVDANVRALIDFTQTGHIGSIANYAEMVAGASPNSNQWAYWKLDEPTGSTTAANSNSAQNPYLNGTYFGTVTLGQSSAIVGERAAMLAGGSAHFDGGTAQMQVPYRSYLNTSVFSCMCWIKLQDSSPSGNEAIIDSANGNYGFDLYQVAGGNQVRFGFGSGSSRTSRDSVALGTSAWHFIVMTYDGTAGSLYADGSLVGSNTAAYSPNTTNPFSIASQNGSFFFHGWIDEVSYFPVALTAQQIAAFYASGTIGPYRHMDDVPDGSTYARTNSSALYGGNVKAAHISDQAAGSQTLTTLTSGGITPNSATVGWNLVGTVAVNIAAGTNSLDFELTLTHPVTSGSGYIADQVGVALYSGSAPSTPTYSSSSLPATITYSSPPTGLVTLGVYVHVSSSATQNATSDAYGYAKQNVVSILGSGKIT